MKDLLSSVHVVIKTLNLEISHLADYVKKLYESAYRMCSTIIFPHSTNQIIVFSCCHCCCCCPCLIKLPNMNKLKEDLVSSTVAYMYSSHTLSTLIKKKHFLFTWRWGWLHIGNIYSITQMKLTALLQGSHLSI